MPTLTLTFPGPIQTSVQVGDMVLYCNTTVSGGFNTAPQSDVVMIGACLTIAANRLSMTVDHDASLVLPAADSFILFSKDKYSNPSGLLGYYAKAYFRNNSIDEAELFGINADMFESSK